MVSTTTESQVRLRTKKQLLDLAVIGLSVLVGVLTPANSSTFCLIFIPPIYLLNTCQICVFASISKTSLTVNPLGFDLHCTLPLG